MKLDHQLTPHTKINSRWVKDLNISHNTIKVLEENIGSKFSDIPCSNIFTDISSRAVETKEKINKWDYIRLKASAWVKKTSPKWKGNQLYGKTYLSMIPQQEFDLQYKKNSHNSTPGRQTIQLKNGQRTWTDTSSKRTYREPIDIRKNAQHH